MQEVITVPMLDPIEHTEANQYKCNDLECPCQLEAAWQELLDVPSYVERKLED